jgi:hypothetical protein
MLLANPTANPASSASPGPPATSGTLPGNKVNTFSSLLARRFLRGLVSLGEKF